MSVLFLFISSSFDRGDSSSYRRSVAVIVVRTVIE